MRATCTYAVLVVALAACTSGGPPYFVPGSGELPACNEAPLTDPTGHWYDQGTVTILTGGCQDAPVGSAWSSCPLGWVITRTGNDVDIMVDDEYRIEGRQCGDQLYLRGGWWLPVQDELEGCTYEDDSAEEVGIEAEGNVLTVGEGVMIGTLVVRGPCSAEYEVTLQRR